MTTIAAAPNIHSTQATAPVRRLPGGRAALAERADRRIAAAAADVLRIVNTSTFRCYLRDRAVNVAHVPTVGLCLLLQSGRWQALNGVLPADFAARAAPMRDVSLTKPFLWTAGAAAFTGLAAAFCSPWVWGLGLCITGLHGAGALILALSKMHVAAVHTQSARLRQLSEEIGEWMQRREDALDPHGSSLQRIYEERRQRTAPVDGLHPPRMLRTFTAS